MPNWAIAKAVDPMVRETPDTLFSRLLWQVMEVLLQHVGPYDGLIGTPVVAGPDVSGTGAFAANNTGCLSVAQAGCVAPAVPPGV